MTRGGPARQVFERLDHSAIFLLVAGTFTPIHGILFRGWLRWGPLFLIWAGAVAGVILKSIFFDDVAQWVGLSTYLALGWFGIFGYVLLARRHGLAFVSPVLWGGVAYTIGGIMELLGWPVLIPGTIHSHDVFHIAVIIGALLHWRFIWTISRGDVQVS
jgi:channel protein (hemolysin III family)